jgi:hypothetical protein
VLISADQQLNAAIRLMKPALEATLDGVCVVDASGRIVWLNLAMKNALGVRGRMLEEGLSFCDHIKLQACHEGCQIERMLKQGRAVRFDDAPARRVGEKASAKETEKMRIMLKATPIQGEGKKVIGGVIQFRDSTGEVLLQAKYHKLMLVVEEKDLEISALKRRVHTLMTSLRRARQRMGG